VVEVISARYWHGAQRDVPCPSLSTAAGSPARHLLSHAEMVRGCHRIFTADDTSWVRRDRIVDGKPGTRMRQSRCGDVIVCSLFW